MPRVPGQLDILPHSYTYYSDQVRKVRDAAGVVHETCMPAPDATWARVTRCKSTQWHLVEPLNTVDDSTVTTCLECVGAGDGAS
jgi:hypothetical protein